MELEAMQNWKVYAWVFRLRVYFCHSIRLWKRDHVWLRIASDSHKWCECRKRQQLPFPITSFRLRAESVRVSFFIQLFLGKGMRFEAQRPHRTWIEFNFSMEYVIDCPFEMATTHTQTPNLIDDFVPASIDDDATQRSCQLFIIRNYVCDKFHWMHSSVRPMAVSFRKWQQYLANVFICRSNDRALSSRHPHHSCVCESFLYDDFNSLFIMWRAHSEFGTPSNQIKRCSEWVCAVHKFRNGKLLSASAMRCKHQTIILLFAIVRLV